MTSFLGVNKTVFYQNQNRFVKQTHSVRNTNFSKLFLLRSSATVENALGHLSQRYPFSKVWLETM